MAPPERGYVGFDGGVSAGIEDFACGDGDDLGHGAPILESAVGCRIDAVLMCDDAVLQAVVEFGTAVYGNARAAYGVNSCDQVNCRLLHQSDSSKDWLNGRDER